MQVIDYGDGRRVQAINLCFEAVAGERRRADDAARDARRGLLRHATALPQPFVPIHEIRVRDAVARRGRACDASAERGGETMAARPTKFIFVTGGVLSSLGKGLASASIGALLEARGLRVTFLKLDPYLNVDPGTMNPFQHGEVYVTDDGAETDLDLGHYERFSHARMGKRQQRHRRAGSTTPCSRRSAAATTWAAPCR